MIRKDDRGHLIVFEGPDSVGKTALAKALVEELTRRGTRCDYFSFPGRDPGTLGRLVYDVHHYPDEFGIHHIDPTSLQLLHIAAHLDSIKGCLLPALEEGCTVILDRFWWSTLVYGIVDGVDRYSLDAMIALELESWTGAQPTVAFLVTRQSPFRTEDSDERWQELRAAYENLGQEQASHHPIETIRNEASLDEALALTVQVLEREHGF
jgi:thymidylate kinase